MMMSMMRHLRQRVGAAYHRLNARAALSGLAEMNPRLGTALIDAIRGKASVAEKDWITRIESLRREMNASSEEVEFTDYGAVSGKLTLTSEDMYRGRVVRKTVGKVCAHASRTKGTALLLFRLVRELKPLNCIELGTALGISASYQAAALRLNGMGKLVTLEGADSLAARAIKNFTALGLSNYIEVRSGRFQDTVAEVLLTHPAVEFAFIDGHHDEAATVRYFELFLPVLVSHAVVVFDDIRWSEGMLRAWDAIRLNEHVRLALDLGSMGVVTLAGGGSPRYFKIAAF